MLARSWSRIVVSKRRQFSELGSIAMTLPSGPTSSEASIE